MSHRAYLFSLEHLGIKLGLEQIRTLLATLGHPDRAFPSIVIAGTNGKGSVTAMTERGLRAAGYRTGRYTSPHLVDLEERFAIDGRSITAGDLERLAGRVRAAARALPAPPSFFEATTALALEAFRDAAVDVAVLEVGLGGRLDATNAVPALAAAITAIDLDHEEYLGQTIEAIAGEKAGIVKPDMVVVVGANRPAVLGILQAECLSRGAAFVDAADGTSPDIHMHAGRATMSVTTPRHRYAGLEVRLRGRHQADNAITAIRLLEELSARDVCRLNRDAIRTAVEQVEWPGRLELVRHAGCDVLLDGAHNPSGARALASYLRETYGRRLPIVLGVMRDKRVDEMILALAPSAAEFVCTAPSSSRAEAPEALAQRAAAAAPDVPRRAVADPRAAVTDAARGREVVIVAGSLYLAGEIRAHLS
jgi:dihydrofolate synthase / folylpolyglutamate synthase